MRSLFFKLAATFLLGASLAGCTAANSGENIIWGNPAIAADPDMVSGTQTDISPIAYAPGESQELVAEKPYFIDFRARNALSYGHTFVVFGKLDAEGNIPVDKKGVLLHSMTEVAGLHPASTSNIPYSIGHVLPVPSETGPSDGDTERAYLLAHYRIDLTPAQYADVVQYIHKLQGSSPVWHAVLYNCSAFVGDIARHMGLKTPNPLLFPQNYIESLKKMNS